MFVDAVNQKVTFIKQETLDTSILYKPVRKLAPTILPNILKDTDDTNPTEEEEA